MDKPTLILQYLLSKSITIARGSTTMISNSVTLDPDDKAARFVGIADRQVDKKSRDSDLTHDVISELTESAVNFFFERRVEFSYV